MESGEKLNCSIGWNYNNGCHGNAGRQPAVFRLTYIRHQRLHDGEDSLRRLRHLLGNADAVHQFQMVYVTCRTFEIRGCQGTWQLITASALGGSRRAQFHEKLYLRTTGFKHMIRKSLLFACPVAVAILHDTTRSWLIMLGSPYRSCKGDTLSFDNKEILHAMSRPVSAISESWAGQFYEHGAGGLGSLHLYNVYLRAGRVDNHIGQTTHSILDRDGTSAVIVIKDLIVGFASSIFNCPIHIPHPDVACSNDAGLFKFMAYAPPPLSIVTLSRYLLVQQRGASTQNWSLIITARPWTAELTTAFRTHDPAQPITAEQTSNITLGCDDKNKIVCFDIDIAVNITGDGEGDGEGIENLGSTLHKQNFLHTATLTSSPSILNELLKKKNVRNILLDSKNPIGLTPLMVASSRGSLRCVQILLGLGADPNVPDNNGDTALVWALLVFGANVEEFNNEKYVTPLHLATQLGQLETMQLLLMSQECRNRLFMRIKNIKTKFKFLLDKKTILKNAWDGKIFLEDLLVLYGKEGCEMIAELKKDPNNRSVLQNRSGRDVKIIMKYSSKCNCLHLAAQSGNVHALEILYCCFLDIESDMRDVKFNCNKYLNMRNDKMLTPLHYAALSGSMSCTQFLIENGSNLMASIKTGGKFSRQSSGIAAMDFILKYVPEGPEMIHDIFSSCVTLGDEDEDGYKDVNLNMKVCYQPIGKKMDVLERLYKNRGRRGSALETFFRINITVVPPVLSVIALFTESRSISCLALIFSWLSLLLYSNILPVFSKHSAMLQHILKRMTVTMVMLTYVLVGFTLTFYLLYRDLNPNKFGNIWSSFLSTTLVLLNGGLDGSALFKENDRDAEVVAGLIHIVFLVTVVLALMNMLLALAIRGGHELEDQGLISELRNKVNLIANMEKIKFSQLYEH
uniref:(California timema) hypothetical protein n=1 Tax=Timema californicum TaxID=61474 RepID=A0A7R9P7W8_TIMCA|nr:unnamed protein product [Timema californicum]